MRGTSTLTRSLLFLFAVVLGAAGLSSCWFFLASFFPDYNSPPVPPIIETVAGNGIGGFSGDGGSARAASLNKPASVAFDAPGNLYVSDQLNGRIRKVDLAGTITTFAGIGGAGFGGDGGAASLAQFNGVAGLAIDSLGNFYVADFNNNRIRRIDTAGTISTVAGNGPPFTFSGDGGLATAAGFNYPVGAAVDAAQNLLIADSWNGRIRRVVNVTQYVTTAAGGSFFGYGGDGGPAASAAMAYLTCVAFDSAGNFYVADTSNNRIRMVNAATAIITTVAGDGTAGYSGDGGPATLAELSAPQCVTSDSLGNLYIADTNNNCVRRVDRTTGIITTVAGNGSAGYSGDGGPATSAKLSGPLAVAVRGGFLYIADAGNNVIRRVP